MTVWSIEVIKILLFNGSYQDEVADSRWLIFPLPIYLDNLILACLVNAMDFAANKPPMRERNSDMMQHADPYGESCQNMTCCDGK